MIPYFCLGRKKIGNPTIHLRIIKKATIKKDLINLTLNAIDCYNLKCKSQNTIKLFNSLEIYIRFLLLYKYKRFSFDRLPYKVLYFRSKVAGVVKLVYTLVLGTSAFGRGGSSPSTGTTFKYLELKFV